MNDADVIRAITFDDERDADAEPDPLDTRAWLAFEVGSRGRLIGSAAWTAQAASARAERDADRWQLRAEQLRAREYQPPHKEPAQQPLPVIIRPARTTRVCPRCHGPVLPRADSGPVPDYCSGRCQAATSDKWHERHRKHKPVRRRGEERRVSEERAVRADGRQGALSFA